MTLWPDLRKPLQACFPAPSQRRGRKRGHALVEHGALDHLVVKALARCPVPRLAAIPDDKEVRFSLRRKGTRCCTGYRRPVEVDGVRAFIGHDERLFVHDGEAVVIKRELSLTERLPLEALGRDGEARTGLDGQVVFEQHSGSHRVLRGRKLRSGVGGLRVVLEDLPCGKCGGCALVKRDDWERRCLEEQRLARCCHFVTLTLPTGKSSEMLAHCRAETQRCGFGDFEALPERVRLTLLQACVAPAVENFLREVKVMADGGSRSKIKTGVDKSLHYFGRSELTKKGNVHVHLCLFFGKGAVYVPHIDNERIGASCEYWRAWVVANGEGERLSLKRLAALTEAREYIAHGDYASAQYIFDEFGSLEDAGYFVTAMTLGVRMDVRKSVRYTCKYTEGDGVMGVRPFVSHGFGSAKDIAKRRSTAGQLDIAAEMLKLGASEEFIRGRREEFADAAGITLPPVRSVLDKRP